MKNPVQSLLKLFSSQQTTSQRQRLIFPDMPAVIYAIGDVHGCIDQLRALEAKIQEDAKTTDGEKWIIYLGDLIDRGPKSAQVIDHVLTNNAFGFKKLCLAGNHEASFIDFIDSACRNKEWLTFGGFETLLSYGMYSAVETRDITLSGIMSHVPSDHIDFIRDLPVMITVGNYVFVHAGIDPGTELVDQKDDTLLWSRPSQFNWSKFSRNMTIVHGHTPVEKVEITPIRINADIGAYARGVLAAVALRPDRTEVILSR